MEDKYRYGTLFGQKCQVNLLTSRISAAKLLKLALRNGKNIDI
ncbi:MAG: hypothetical protein RI922_2635 [Bacteroidota bacterium]|jgi:hypothetical protein